MQLRFLNFETGSSHAITQLSIFAHADVSSDERWLVSPVPGKPDGNVMLVENFH